MAGTVCIAVVLACALLVGADRSVAATSASYGTAAFSDGFESGSLSAWNGYSGTGTGAVVAAAAHGGSSGLRLTNAAGQYGLVQKALASPLVDSSTKFWVRVGSGTGLRELAEARDQASNSTMWAILYDGSSHALWFYPFRGSSSTEIFTGANSVPANTWTQIEVQYRATAGGGAALLINGATQAAWAVSGDYTRSTNLQRLQLWDDAADTSDFDDVTIATPSTTTQTAPGAPTGVSGVAGNASVALSWTAPASNGGSAITGYRITPYIGTTAQTPITTGTIATTRSLTGLANGTAYTFRVAATNAVGTGSDSAASAAVTPRALTAPGAPTALAGTAGNASVDLTWTAPSSNGGSAITGYRITPFIGSAAQTAVNTGSTTAAFHLTGLANGTAYTFTVAATNAIGTGAASSSSAAITPVVPPPAKTVVSIEFDDNVATQFQTLAMLQAHGMHATFYVNSGLTPDDIEWRMDWSELLQLSAAGNEIGGHTWDHADLTLPGTDLHHEICDDRTNIQAHGLPLPSDMAYPYGADEATGVPAAVKACGYTSGRIVGGIHSSICPTGCPFAESIPPLDPYQTRTAPDVRIGDSLATVEAYVTQAEQHGGGWVQLVFHDLCATNCAGDDYSTTPALFNSLLDWLQPRAANGTVVKTVAQVMSGG